jgi:hypothetical protein
MTGCSATAGMTGWTVAPVSTGESAAPVETPSSGVKSGGSSVGTLGKEPASLCGGRLLTSSSRRMGRASVCERRDGGPGAAATPRPGRPGSAIVS